MKTLNRVRKKVIPLSKFAVFVDLENCGAKVDTLNSIIEKVRQVESGIDIQRSRG